MPFYYGMYYDSAYMIGTVFVLIAALFAGYAQLKVQSSYAKYKKVPNSRSMTGAYVARDILNKAGLYDIRVEATSGNLTDHYHPTQKVIRLSNDIYNGTSIAALAVAAHECGHAIQHAEGYAPISIRNMILPFANIGQYLGWIAIMIGLALGSTNIAWIGFMLMLGILLFQLFTLPVEFDASHRAMDILESYYLDRSELKGARNMLSAAALTYIAALISTLMSMLRIFLLIASRSDDR